MECIYEAPHCPCFSKRENTACRAGILWLLKEDNYLITVRRLARDNALSSCWNNSRVTSSIWQKTKVPSTLQPNLKLITSSIPLVDVFLKILQKFVSLFNPFLAVSCMPGWQLGLALWRCRRKGCLAAIKVVLKHRFMIGQESKDTPRKTVSDYRAFLLENNNVLAKLMIYRKIWVRQLRAYPWEWWQNRWDWMQLQALNIPPPHGSDQSRYLGTDSVLFLLPRIKDGASLYNSKSLQEETIRRYQEERKSVTFQCLRSHFWTTHRLSQPHSLEGRCVCAAMLQGTWNEFPCSRLLSEHVRT